MVARSDRDDRMGWPDAIVTVDVDVNVYVNVLRRWHGHGRHAGQGKGGRRKRSVWPAGSEAAGHFPPLA